MATLLELNTIEMNSTATAGEPPDAAIVAAQQLRAKVRTAVLKQANTILSTPLPTSEALRGDALEALAWAQRAVDGPDQYTAQVFRLSLVKAPAGATPAAILASTDAAIEAMVQPVLGLLAKGMHPGQR